MSQSESETFPERLSRQIPGPLKTLLRPLARAYFKFHDAVKIGQEWIKYYWFRAHGGSWTEYYRQRRDAGAASGPDQYRANYLEGAEGHFQFLLGEGLKPDDQFLDYGAGYLRLACYLVPYLDDHHYTAVDISFQSMKRGQALLEERRIPPSAYRTIVVSDCDLAELNGERFNVIWAQSVLTHMPLENIRIWFRSLANAMSIGARVFFSFAPGKSRQINVKDFYYEPEIIEQEARDAGFDWRICENWDDGGLSLMVCLTRRSQ